MTETPDLPGHVRVFPPDPKSVGAARGFVRELVGDGERSDDVVLLTSELASNAVRHARSEFKVEVLTGNILRVEVTDDSPQLPVLAGPKPHAPGGRGLGIVDALSLAWGVERGSPGKVIWFEIDP